jgi:hypothetical protein
MNNRARAADECRRENHDKDEKERGFDKKGAAGLGSKIVPANIEKRRSRTIGLPAVIPIMREDLIIAIGDGELDFARGSTKIPAVRQTVSLKTRFHLSRVFLL